MGGNALKTIETRRLVASEYHALVSTVLGEVSSVIGRERAIAALSAYRQKPDFGDMDLLIESDGLPDNYRVQLAEVFKSREVAHTVNSEVTSFDRDGFQIDVIECPRESFAFARNYLAWNDLCNLLGFMAAPIGLRLTTHGLYMPVAVENGPTAQALVTLDFNQAIETLGYFAKDFRAGFDSMEDIFRFVASAPNFSPTVFEPRTQNSEARRRFAKRKTQASFLAWMAAPEGLTAFRPEPEAGWYQFPNNKGVWLTWLSRRFPGLLDRMREAAESQVPDPRLAAAKAAFNGDLVSQLTGLRGKDLGQLIEQMRTQHASPVAFADWILGMDAATLRKEILRNVAWRAQLMPPASDRNPPPRADREGSGPP